MIDRERKQKAKEFAAYWKDKGYEKGESQTFWHTFLRDVLGVEKPEQIIKFEEPVCDIHTKFIDGWIEGTRVLIEQKSSTVNLKAPIKQSNGSFLTPFEQALKYNNARTFDKKARWIIVCNFKEFHIYDMNVSNPDPDIVLLKDLPKEYWRLEFICNKKSELIKREEHISIKAGEIVGKIYEALSKKYSNIESDFEEQRSLNILCVRLVFCLYAEDAGLFSRNQFYNFIKSYNADNVRDALIKLFKILDTKKEDRDPYENGKLLAFPHVNGGLFEEEDIKIPQFDENIVATILISASLGFNWSEISPTIFGAVFESTLNPETRRNGGMHYTSVENIHKVIDPLFLNELKEEFAKIKENKQINVRNSKLTEFQHKLASLNFLDPACGSGNFLTETYISLRKLENEAICLQLGDGVMTFLDDVIKVSISQFYGIEINDFAVTVAKTALWIAESQMMKQTEEIVKQDLNFLPLKSYANIVEANALRVDWETVCPKEKLSYIMGNPPFVGARMMDQGSEQKREVQDIFGDIKDVQDLDYVTCWYKLAAKYIQNTNIEVAFVSTNSICQGAQVPILWDVLFNQYNIHINFAYQTFKWGSESNEQAAVHCVIVGFSNFERSHKTLFSTDIKAKNVANISPYLIEGGNQFVVANKDALCDVPKMIFGNQPRDGGYFILTEEEKESILSKEPSLQAWIRPYMGADEFIKGKNRYCLWLVHASPADIIHSKILSEKVEAVRQFRTVSKAKTTNGYAKVPHCFAQMTQPENVDYLLVPSVSSERRKYIPIGFLTANTISSNAVQIVPNATLYHFGVLTSNVHMAWMRTVAGRLKSDYRYSKEIVYNTFPWCTPTVEQKQKIEETAQAILDARKLYSDCSFSEMYGEKMYLFTQLLQAHKDNDKAVMEAYGFSSSFTESMIVESLMEMYQKLTDNK